MTPDQIQSLLPPIVLSLGAILPFLVASPPFSIASNARMLLICVMTLVIWLGYWTAYAFGSWAFASLLLTVFLIAVALFLFAAIFFVAQRPPSEIKGPDGKSILDTDGKPVRVAAIDRPGWLWLYLGGLLAVSVAAALYVGPRDWVLIEFEVPNLKGTQSVMRIAKVVGVNSSVSLDRIGHSVMLPKAEFDGVSQFLINVDGPANDGSLFAQFSASPSNKNELLRPGLGKHYRIPAEPK